MVTPPLNAQVQRNKGEEEGPENFGLRPSLSRRKINQLVGLGMNAAKIFFLTERKSPNLYTIKHV